MTPADLLPPPRLGLVLVWLNDGVEASFEVEDVLGADTVLPVETDTALFSGQKVISYSAPPPDGAAQVLRAFSEIT